MSTLRRRNSSRSREESQHGAAQGEEHARGPPPRQRDGQGNGERLELGAADRRLDALLEEERARAASVPARPDVKRLEVRSGAGSQPSQPVQDVGQGARDALNDPRAEALGLGALQDAVRHSFGLLQQALGRGEPQQGLLGPLLGGNDQGAAHEVLANTGGGRSLFASPRMTRTDQEVQRRLAWPLADNHLAWPSTRMTRTKPYCAF